jgi:hypothetical protein
LSEVFKAIIGACGPYNLGGSATLINRSFLLLDFLFFRGDYVQPMDNHAVGRAGVGVREKGDNNSFVREEGKRWIKDKKA